MSKHIHAENMALYAQDAQETPEPWSRWETSPNGREWIQLTGNPSWATSIQYRRKPKMLSVTLANGEVVSWPEPARKPLNYGSVYYILNSLGCSNWFGDRQDFELLEKGLLHTSETAAAQHASALHKINTQDRDDG